MCWCYDGWFVVDFCVEDVLVVEFVEGVDECLVDEVGEVDFVVVGVGYVVVDDDVVVDY